MLKTFIAVALVTLIGAAAASARGGGAAETMPSFGYTDLPPFSPKPSEPFKRIHHTAKYLRWHRGRIPAN